MRNAQIAMESMMMYGWIIIIVTAAVAVLAYNGVFTADRLLMDTCSTTTPFTCTEAKVTPGNASNVQLFINNGAAEDMTNVGVSLSCDDGSLATVESGTGTALANTAAQHIIFTCPQPTAGLRWKGNFTIDYTKSGESISHQVPGSLTVHVEP